MRPGREGSAILREQTSPRSEEPEPAGPGVAPIFGLLPDLGPDEGRFIGREPERVAVDHAERDGPGLAVPVNAFDDCRDDRLGVEDLVADARELHRAVPRYRESTTTAMDTGSCGSASVATPPRLSSHS